jgi:hypothetical protein
MGVEKAEEVVGDGREELACVGKSSIRQGRVSARTGGRCEEIDRRESKDEPGYSSLASS